MSTRLKTFDSSGLNQKCPSLASHSQNIPNAFDSLKQGTEHFQERLKKWKNNGNINPFAI